MSHTTTQKRIDLVYVTVSDLDKGIAYYTEVLGLKLLKKNEALGWAELQGEGGAILGIGKAQQGMVPGQNAIIGLTVENLKETKEELKKKGVSFKGDIIDIPGEGSLQSCVDPDGNAFDLYQPLQ